MKEKYVSGVDLSSCSDVTVYSLIAGRQCGKTLRMDQRIEALREKGETVIDLRIPPSTLVNCGTIEYDVKIIQEPKRSKDIAWESVEKASGMSFKDWDEYLNKIICDSFAVPSEYFTSPGVIDPTIEMIDSNKPDILEVSDGCYREERKVN